MSQYNKAQREKKKMVEKLLEEEKEKLIREYNMIVNEVHELQKVGFNYEMIQLMDNLEEIFNYDSKLAIKNKRSLCSTAVSRS